MFSTLISSLRKTRWPKLLMWALGIGAIFWICTFKIMDRDFWWHITAGKILLSTHHMITVDPFAYTREGLPYLATHEWLAQIILSKLYSIFGSTGVILFRGVIACATFGTLLLLVKKLRYSSLLLVVLAVALMKGSFLERPQLFTFIFFSLFILLAFRFLDATTQRARYKIGLAWIILELLWVNMHGGAALLGCAIVSFVLAQQCVGAPWRQNRFEHAQSCKILLGVLMLMAVTLVLPPNGLGTISYLRQLLNDQTIQFIAEWMPRPFLLSLKDLWIFGLLAVLSLGRARKHVVFTSLLFLMSLYLSRQAIRHEILFVISAVAMYFYHVDRSEWWQMQDVRIGRYPRSALVVGIILTLLVGYIASARSFSFERKDNLFGFGQFDLARGAVDFLDTENIQGNMFNTYGIGGYLIHRGFPDRKVFIDGRNVDYGLDFLARAYAAGVDAEHWDSLVARYTIDYAVVDYDAIREKDQLPYSSLLDTRPDWPLVYIDDWVAIYLRRIPQNQSLIDRFAYKYITPSAVEFQRTFEHIDSAKLPDVILELQRMYSDNPEGVKATLALANIALRTDRLDDAKTLAEQARLIRPYSPEPLVILAAIFMKQEQWQKAADVFEDVLSLAGDDYPDLNYSFVANIFEKAGHPWKAWYYRLGTHPASVPLSETGSVSVASDKPALMVNPAQDAQMFHDEALKQIEAEEFAHAEESFLTSLKINPSSAEAWNNLCALYLQLKRDTEAIDACKRATELYPEYADAHYNLALGFFRTGGLVDAEREALQSKKFGLTTQADQLLQLIHKQKK